MTDHPRWLRAFWRLHRLIDRLSGGRLGTRVLGIPSLWLTTVGRSTGQVRTSPRTTVRIGREVVPVVAREATAEERDRLWPRLVELNPEYATYQAATDRPIQVVILEGQRSV